MTRFVQQFTEEESWDLGMATTFDEAKEVAISQLRRLKGEWGVTPQMVFGPMTSGGLGCEKKNRVLFSMAVDTLRCAGYPIFCQTQYEMQLRQIELLHDRRKNDGYLFRDLLSCFYKPIIRSGLVACGHFVPGWDSSEGSQIEQAELVVGGIPRSFLGRNLLPRPIRYI